MKPSYFIPVPALLAGAGVSRAAVSWTSGNTFNSSTGQYTYSYSVVNSGSPEELIQVTFPVSPLAALMGLTAPPGFKITYDTVGARVNFIWDDDEFTPQTFAPESTVSGFSFTSPVGPGLVDFIASDINQDFTGSTPAPVPEPSAGLLGLGALGLLLRRRRCSARA
jgi:MYXO-CTERM domain-containing protein